MTKRKAIVFDVDEIMLDHLGGFRDWLKKKHGIICKSDYPSEYDLTEWMGVEDQKEVVKYLKEFNETAWEFGVLQPQYECVKAYMCALRHTFPDAVFAALTKSGTMGHGEVLRRANLEHVYPNILDEVHIVEMYESKRGALHKLQAKYDVVALVDDYIENIETAVNMGIRGIMLQCPHNQQYKDREDFHYAENWAGVIHELCFVVQKGE